MTLEQALAIIETLRQTVVQQAQQIDAQAQQNDAQAQQIETLTAQNAALTQQVADLEERLNRHSGNSDKPPSSDSVFRSPKTEANRRKRQRKKRAGKARVLLPVEAVDHVVGIAPEQCQHCGDPLTQDDVVGQAQRHQVTDIPEPKAVVTEYQLHRAHCLHCRRFTRGDLPEGVGLSAFGPRVTALVATWAVAYRLSKRQIQQLLADVWGITISRGAVSRCEQRVSQAIANAVDEAALSVKNASTVYADETPWKQRHKLHWLWAAGSESLWVFQVRADRSRRSAEALLGESFQGTLVADDYGAYRFVVKRQQCWSHLLRRFVTLSEFKKDPIAVAVGQRGCHFIAKMMARVRAHKRQGVHHDIYLKQMTRIRRQMMATLSFGCTSTSPWTKSKCQRIVAMGDALWAFIAHPERVEPTNNRAERAIRHAVLYRKLSHGTQSDAGSRFVERMLSVTQTLKQQGRAVLAFVHAALLASTTDALSPSLLPAPLSPSLLPAPCGV